MSIDFLAALIEPATSTTGYVTCLGLDNSSNRGVYHYNIQTRPPALRKIANNHFMTEQVFALAYWKNENKLFIQKSNGDIMLYDPNSDSLSIFYRSAPFPNGTDISPGCGLKLSRSGQNLFIITESYKLKILSDLKQGTFGSSVEISLPPSEKICDF